MRSVNHYLPQITDPTLRAQVKGFFGQEGRHAHEHERVFRMLEEQGYDVQRFLKLYERIGYDVIERITDPATDWTGPWADFHGEHIPAAQGE